MESKSNMNIRIVIYGVVAFLALCLLMGSCTVIDTGNVGVVTTMGQISKEERQAGITLKLPLVTSIDEYNVREAALDLKNLTPKAKDNLSLKDLDVSIFYEVEPTKAADLVVEYQGQSIYDDENGVYMPGQGIIYRLSREAIYDTVSTLDSLTIHQKRVQLVSEINRRLVKKLDTTAPGTFRVTNIVIRAITTDPSIESSIRAAVQAQKQLEQMEVQTHIAEKEAQIKITEARGIAEANRIINSTLTREYLQHESNEAMMEFAKGNKTSTVVIPSNMSSAPLMIGK